MGGDVSPEAEGSDWPALKDQPSPIAAAVFCVSLLHAGSTKEPIKQQSGGIWSEPGVMCPGLGLCLVCFVRQKCVCLQ